MIGARQEPVLRHIDRIFGFGTLAGLTDAQLLERFVTCGDAPAFEALVARHGPMVLAVCRGVLRDAHAAEDAFQVTFLILVRKAGAIRGRGALGGWLHRVAHRVAVQASADAHRRRAQERNAEILKVAGRPGDEPRDDTRAAIHEEVARLPERYRLPVVLCYLEGRTHAEAAADLHCGEATVRRRLAAARERLRTRLSRRGVVTPAGALALALTREAMAAVPDALLAATARAAAGHGPATAVAVLTANVIRVMLATKLKATAIVLLGIAALASVGWLLAASGSERAAPPVGAPSAVARVAAAPKDESGATVALRGIVVDPAGRPVERAVVRFFDPLELVKDDALTARSGPGGRFDLRVPRTAFDDHSRSVVGVKTCVVATAEGFGFAWNELDLRPDGPPELSLRLVADDVPVEGQLVDLEGRPVAGALVKSRDAWFSREGDLSAWMKRMQLGTSGGFWQGLDHVPLAIAATSGPDGRFTLAGVGPERVVDLLVSGPGVASAELAVMTRYGPEVHVPSNSNAPGNLGYHTARFVHALAPGRVIEGVVRDQDTGATTAGVEISGRVYDTDRLIFLEGVAATTDASGRYRLAGLKAAHAYRVFATPAAGSPYPNASFRVPADATALGPLQFDLALKRGVLIEGRVTDKSTGKPVRGYVQTYTFNDNAFMKTFPGYKDSDALFAQLDPDGRFAIAALPGRGLVAARSDLARYRRAQVTEGIKGLSKDLSAFATSPHNCTVSGYHAIVEINPDAQSRALTVPIQVDPGRSVSGTVVDPDGRPLGGTKAAGLSDLFGRSFRPLDSAEFEVRGLAPDEPRGLYFVHEGRRLAGALVVQGDEPGPLTVKLEPWGVVTGRIVDDDGEPRSKLKLYGNINALSAGLERGALPDDELDPTDRNGRFRIEGLIPGLKYEVWASTSVNRLSGKVFEGVQVSSGATRDLGDLKIKRPKP